MGRALLRCTRAAAQQSAAIPRPRRASKRPRADQRRWNHCKPRARTEKTTKTVAVLVEARERLLCGVSAAEEAIGAQANVAMWAGAGHTKRDRTLNARSFDGVNQAAISQV